MKSFFKKKKGDKVYVVYIMHEVKTINKGYYKGYPWIDHVSTGNGIVKVVEFTLAAKPFSDGFIDINGRFRNIDLPGNYDLVTGSKQKAMSKANELCRYYTKKYKLFKSAWVEFEKVGVKKCETCGAPWKEGRKSCSCEYVPKWW